MILKENDKWLIWLDIVQSRSLLVSLQQTEQRTFSDGHFGSPKTYEADGRIFVLA